MPSGNPGGAERQLGSESDALLHRGFYSRGYLPHVDYPGALQAITYRLADSLPASKIERIEAELRELPQNVHEAERRRRLETFLDSGHGSCLLRNPIAARCVIENWHHFARRRYDLIAWVVMPNHVHVLVRIYPGVPLAKVVQSWKSFSGRRMARLRSSSSEGRIWMREYWDRFIRDESHFHRTMAYIHENPVRAGLVDDARRWPWSSAGAEP